MPNRRQRRVETAMIVGPGHAFGDQLSSALSHEYQGIVVMGLSQWMNPDLAANVQYEHVVTDLREPQQHADNMLTALAEMPPLGAVIFGAKSKLKTDVDQMSAHDLEETFAVAVGGMQTTYQTAAGLLAHQRAASLRFLEINGNFAKGPDHDRAALSASLAARRNLGLSWHRAGFASKSLTINGVVAADQIPPGRVVDAIIDHLHGPMVRFERTVSKPGI